MNGSPSVRLAERAYQALEDDFEAFLAMCADDVELVYPGEGVLRYGGRFRGREEVRRWGDLHDEVEEIRDLQIDHLLPSGEFVVVIGRFQGRALQTGRPWETPFVHVLTIADGQISRFEAFFDSAVAAAAHGTSLGTQG